MYDPVPDLAQLIDGLRGTATADDQNSLMVALAVLLHGPYARLRGGLLLDEPGWEDQSTADAIRIALDEYRELMKGTRT